MIGRLLLDLVMYWILCSVRAGGRADALLLAMPGRDNPAGAAALQLWFVSAPGVRAAAASSVAEPAEWTDGRRVL